MPLARVEIPGRDAEPEPCAEDCRDKQLPGRLALKHGRFYPSSTLTIGRLLCGVAAGCPCGAVSGSFGKVTMCVAFALPACQPPRSAAWMAGTICRGRRGLSASGCELLRVCLPPRPVLAGYRQVNLVEAKRREIVQGESGVVRHHCAARGEPELREADGTLVDSATRS